MGHLGVERTVELILAQNPQTNPQPEGFIRTLLSMLRTLGETHKHQWSRHVSQFVHAYNSARNDTIAVMFGIEAGLPIDICFGTDKQEAVSHSQYVEKIKRTCRTPINFLQNRQHRFTCETKGTTKESYATKC